MKYVFLVVLFLGCGSFQEQAVCDRPTEKAVDRHEMMIEQQDDLYTQMKALPPDWRELFPGEMADVRPCPKTVTNISTGLGIVHVRDDCEVYLENGQRSLLSPEDVRWPSVGAVAVGSAVFGVLFVPGGMRPSVWPQKKYVFWRTKDLTRCEPKVTVIDALDRHGDHPSNLDYKMVTKGSGASVDVFQRGIHIERLDLKHCVR